MKKITKSILALLIIAAAVQSCKKGEEDPGLSLRSRKSRVEGTWKVTSNETKGNYTSTQGTTTSSGSFTETITDASYSQSSSSTNGSTTTTNTVTGTVSENTYTFDKAGTWAHKMTYVTKATDDQSQSGYTYIDVSETTYKIDESGVWNFLGKIQDDTKNKEEMSVSVTKRNNVTTTVNTTTQGFSGSITTSTSTNTQTNADTYDVNDNVDIWKLKMLKNKEMHVVIYYKENDNNTTSSTSGSTTTSSSSTDTGEETSNMTLVQ